MEKEIFQNMMKKYDDINLTKKQENILYIISNYIEEKHISPTVREIAEIANIKSTATVHKHLNGLENKGIIQKDYGSPRSIKIVISRNLKDKNEKVCDQTNKLKKENNKLKNENQRLKILLAEARCIIQKIEVF